MKKLLAVGGTVLAAHQFTAHPELVLADGFDDTGDAMLIQSVNKGDDTLRRAFVHPEAKKFTMTFACANGQRLIVDGKTYDNMSNIEFKRRLDVHLQSVEVQCETPKAIDNVTATTQSYLFHVTSNWELDQIVPPSIQNNGMDCVFNNKYIECPPSEDSVAVIYSESNPTIKYTIHDSSHSIDMRLLGSEPTLPFTHSKTMYITAEGGRHKITWTVTFGGSIIHSILSGIGYLLAGLLSTLLLAFLVIVGTASAIGQGIPLGSTEVAAALTLVLQYLIFANFLRGSSNMESLVTPLKWVSLFWPAPILESDISTTHHGSVTFRRSLGVKLWGNSIIGDPTDINNAWGCIVWCLLILSFVLIFHGIVIMSINVKRFTKPHCFAFGNWETRVINWLLFPLTTASFIILFNPDATPVMKAVGAGTMVVMTIVLGVMFQATTSAVANGEVCWVWNSSVRESGVNREEEMDGYWTDVTADQLKTQPVNRAFWQTVFPFTWVSTVADIQPTTVPAAENDGVEVKPTRKLKKSHGGASYPLAKNPHIVQVTRARQPCGAYRGHRLIAGLLRTKWLDILFTYEGLVKFHAEDRGSVEVPLVVKTQQLSGPITDGYAAFFFDGVRVPFVRFAESFYKMFLGVAVALCVISTSDSYRAAGYFASASLSAVFGTYVISTKPYNRRFENWLMIVTCGVIGISAFFFGYFRSASRDTWMGDALLSLFTTLALVLGIYSALVTLSIFGAVFCPPLDETRFLEKLANCTVIVTNASETDEYELNAYSKYSSRDLLTKSKSGRVQVHKMGTHEDLEIQLDHEDIRQACVSGVVAIP